VFDFTINILERVSTRLSFLGFESRRINFKVSLIISHHLSVIFNFMKTVALLAFGTMYMAGKDSMITLPTILILRNTGVHVGFSDGCDMLSYIETFVNKTLSLYTILKVPNVNLYNSHIGLGGSLDDASMRY